MSDPIYRIPNIQVQNVSIPYTYIPSWQIRQPQIPNFNPITSYIGFPIVDMPGCVEMHKDNKRHNNGVPIDKNLIENDPATVMTICPDGSYPSYR